MTEAVTTQTNDDTLVCHMCGEPIGTEQVLNVVMYCDEPRNNDKAWCARCFAFTPCGIGKHGEGCPTKQICSAA